MHSYRGLALFEFHREAYLSGFVKPLSIFQHVLDSLAIALVLLVHSESRDESAVAVLKDAVGRDLDRIKWTASCGDDGSADTGAFIKAGD